MRINLNSLHRQEEVAILLVSSNRTANNNNNHISKAEEATPLPLHPLPVATIIISTISNKRTMLTTNNSIHPLVTLQFLLSNNSSAIHHNSSTAVEVEVEVITPMTHTRINSRVVVNLITLLSNSSTRTTAATNPTLSNNSSGEVRVVAMVGMAELVVATAVEATGVTTAVVVIAVVVGAAMSVKITEVGVVAAIEVEVVEAEAVVLQAAKS